MKTISALVIALTMALTVGCHKTVTAPVPGTINTFDAYAARTVGDAQIALVSAKTWELCSDQSFPATVTFDSYTNSCDKTAGPFPAVGRAYLLKAEQSYNVALSAAKAYHAGASSDTAGLTTALTELGTDIANMLTGIGKGQ